jgi:hypothetical protein
MTANWRAIRQIQLPELAGMRPMSFQEAASWPFRTRTEVLRALPASTIPAKWEPRPPLCIGQPDIQLIEAGMRPPQRSAKSHCSYTRRDAHTSCSAEHSPPIAIAHTCKALQPVGSPYLGYRRDPRVLQLVLADHCRARGESMQSQKRYTTRLQIQCV